MKKKFAAFAAALAVTAGVTVVTALPASADDPYLCMTTENTPFYSAPDTAHYLFTLSPGRGFRLNGAGEDDGQGHLWTGGHGAEHPDVEGWVLDGHLSCP